MGDIFSQLKDHLLSPVRAIGVLATAIILAIAGPFGTFMSMAFSERLLYWGAVVAISAIFVQFVKVFIDIKFSNQPTWKKALAVSTLLTVFLTPVLYFLTIKVNQLRPGYFAPIWLFAVLTFSLTNIVILSQSFLGYNIFKDKPRLYQRLRNSNTKKIYRLSVRDHYVDVYSETGKETILMRFSDALIELDGQLGKQIHRSHWISCDEVHKLKKIKGRLFVWLKDGSRLPISRSYQQSCLAEFQSLQGVGIT
ncbi:MAG: LytTR family DNA-binding domain-containing protein [Paracoccaceae bacterium]